jgi:hypothetical protein
LELVREVGMTIKIQGTYVIVRKKGAAPIVTMKALTLREATDKANEDWLTCCDEKTLDHDVLIFENIGNYHIANTGSLTPKVQTIT